MAGEGTAVNGAGLKSAGQLLLALTGAATLAAGALLYGDGDATLATLSPAATGNVLLSDPATPSWGKVGLTTHISGVLPVANGGTNIASYAVGDLIYASGATTLSKLADVAVGSALISGGVATAPAWSTSMALLSTIASKQAAAAGISLDHNSATGNFTLRLSPANLATANRRWTFADKDDTVAGLTAQTFSGIQTFTLAPVMSALTASRLVRTDASKALESNAALTATHVLFADANGWPTGNAALVYASSVLEIASASASPVLRLKQNSAATNSPAIEFYSGGGYRHQILEVEGAAGYLSFVSVDGTGYRFDSGVTLSLGTGTALTVSSTSTSTTPSSNSIYTLGGIGAAGSISSAGSANRFVSGSVAASGSLIQALKTSTATSGNDWSLLVVTTLNPAGASTQNASALAGNVTLAAGASGVSGSIVGLDGAIDADATANTFASVTALRGTLRKGGANTLTNAAAIEASLSTSAAGTITVAYGIHVSGMANSGGATIGTAYGLKIADITVGATNYSILTGLGLVYFADTSANALRCAGGILSIGATQGIGYATGAGGTVTQATSRSTGVTLNKVCGQIALVSAAGSTSWTSFTVTNSAVASTDVVRVCQDSGTDKYQIHVTAVGAGSFEITFATTGGTTSEQPVFSFVVIKAVTA